MKPAVKLSKKYRVVLRHSLDLSYCNFDMFTCNDPSYYPTYKYCVVSDWGYYKITYFLTKTNEEEAKKKLREFLKDKGYSRYLEEVE